MNIDKAISDFEKNHKVQYEKVKSNRHKTSAHIIDESNGRFFMIDNDFIDKYAKFVKSAGTDVYIALKRHCNNNTKEAFPGLEHLALEMGMSIFKVKMGVKALECFNIITVERERGMHNIYTLKNKKFWKKVPKSTWCNQKQNL